MSNADTAPTSGANRSTQPRERAERDPPCAKKMSDLLRRYPNIQDGERLELLDFIKRGHPEELAMATYGAGLEPRVIAFKRDHPEHFRSGWRAWLPWLAFLLVPLVLMLLARLL